VNVRTDVCRPQFEQNFISNGYTQNLTNAGSSYPRYELGAGGYQVYRSKSDGGISGYYNSGSGSLPIKIRLPPQ
jgi:hypothetical protein